MKKILICAAVLLLAVTAVTFADRAAIDEVIQAYEAVVVEAENVAEMSLIATADLSALEEKADEVIPAIEAIQDEREWVIGDAKNLAELNGRFNEAMTKIAQTLLQY